MNERKIQQKIENSDRRNALVSNPPQDVTERRKASQNA